MCPTDTDADAGAERQPVGLAERERFGGTEREPERQRKPQLEWLGGTERLGGTEWLRRARRTRSLAERQPELIARSGLARLATTDDGTAGCRTVRRCSPS